MMHAFPIQDSAGFVSHDYDHKYYRCNRLRCPLARLSVLQCYNMGHNGHGIKLYGVIMTLMGNLHAGEQYNLGHLSLLHRCDILTLCL